MQLFAQFKRILRWEFRATLKFWKFKVALIPFCRICLNFAKSCILSCWLQLDNKIWGSLSSFLNYKHLKLKLRVFFAGHIVPMVTNCATKLTATCSLIIGQFVHTMILALTGREWLQWPIKLYVLEVLETVSSHLKRSNSKTRRRQTLKPLNKLCANEHVEFPKEHIKCTKATKQRKLNKPSYDKLLAPPIPEYRIDIYKGPVWAYSQNFTSIAR